MSLIAMNYGHREMNRNRVRPGGGLGCGVKDRVMGVTLIHGGGDFFFTGSDSGSKKTKNRGVRQTQ